MSAFSDFLVFPFYHEVLAVEIAPISPSENYFWSYKSESSGILGHDNYWLPDYWFSLRSAFGLETSWMLIAMFTIQLLTLALGLVSIRFNRRSLLFSPVLLTFVVAVLMTYTGKIFGHPPYRPLLHAISPEYQLGYYLVYPSLAMFLFAFLLNAVTRKIQTIKPAKENLNTLYSSVKNYDEKLSAHAKRNIAAYAAAFRCNITTDTKKTKGGGYEDNVGILYFNIMLDIKLKRGDRPCNFPRPRTPLEAQRVATLSFI